MDLIGRSFRMVILGVVVAFATSTAVAAQDPAPDDSPTVPTRLAWQLVDDPDIDALPSSAPFYDVAAGPDGIIALAADTCGRSECIRVVASDDGLDWTVSPDPLRGFPIDIAWGPAGYLILASIKDRHVVYLSPDGHSWERVDIPGLKRQDAAFTAIGAPDGYLLAGCAGLDEGEFGGCVRAKIWSSSDGRDWSAQNPQGGEGVLLIAGAARSGKAVLLGVPIGEATGPGVILVSDGPGWAPASLPLSARLRRDGLMQAIVSTPNGGFAVLGDAYDVKADKDRLFVLTSPDGSTWQIETPGPRMPGSTSTEAAPDGNSGPGIAMLPGRLAFSAGAIADNQFLWWTPDGSRWDMSILSLEPYSGASFNDIAQTAAGDLIAVGIGSGGEALPEIWRGSIVASGPPTGPVGGEPPPATLPRSSPDRLAYLLAHAPDATRCRPIARKEVRSRHPEAVAAIQCTGSGAIETVRYYLFPTAERMAAWWAKTLALADVAGLEPAGGSFGACLVGIPGETGWQAGTLTGRVDCYRESGTGSLARQQFANVRWTDDAQLIGTWAVGADDDLGALFAEFAAGRAEAPVNTGALAAPWRYGGHAHSSRPWLPSSAAMNSKSPAAGNWAGGPSWSPAALCELPPNRVPKVASARAQAPVLEIAGRDDIGPAQAADDGM